MTVLDVDEPGSTLKGTFFVYHYGISNKPDPSLALDTFLVSFVGVMVYVK